MSNPVYMVDGHPYKREVLVDIMNELREKAIAVHGGLDEFTKAEQFTYHILMDIPDLLE